MAGVDTYAWSYNMSFAERRVRSMTPRRTPKCARAVEAGPKALSGVLELRSLCELRAHEHGLKETLTPMKWRFSSLKFWVHGGSHLIRHGVPPIPTPQIN